MIGQKLSFIRCGRKWYLWLPDYEGDVKINGGFEIILDNFGTSLVEMIVTDPITANVVLSKVLDSEHEIVYLIKGANKRITFKTDLINEVFEEIPQNIYLKTYTQV